MQNGYVEADPTVTPIARNDEDEQEEGMENPTPVYTLIYGIIFYVFDFNFCDR